MFEVVGGSDDGVIRRCSDGDVFANTDDGTGGWLDFCYMYGFTSK